MIKSTLYKQVEFCLDKYPETRNSDIALTIQIWRSFQGVVSDYINVNDLYTLPREDNIKRIRATIQNDEGRFLPTDWEVAKKRRILRKTWEIALGYQTQGHNVNVVELKQKETQLFSDNKYYQQPE